MRSAPAPPEPTDHASLSGPDQTLLDEAFERALASWEDGSPLAPADLLPGRPDLLEHAERILALAQEVAVTGPAPGPTPAVPGYTILSQLGRGAMGTVYFARQDRLGGRPVALKVLPAGAAVSARARDRFQAEANAVARLRHAHIVTVHDVVREGNLIAFAMEPVDGPSLHDVIGYLQSLGRPPNADDVRSFLGSGSSALGAAPYWTIIARVGAAIARALHAVHEAGLLHRDVKPSNILLRRDGTPLLSDFGLVRDPDSHLATRDGFIGTPAYAPPEQFDGGAESLDARSDVYALGATLYHALTLVTPFAGRTTPHDPPSAEPGPVPLRTACHGLPSDLCTIISKAMAPAPADRYASADQFADDLDRLLSERPILARAPGVVARTVKLLRRNRKALKGAIAGAIAVLLLVGGLTFGLVIMPRWAQEARERAWLALLDPRDAINFANAGLWQATFPGPPRPAGRLIRAALAEYENAVRYQPWDERTTLERDVLRTMISMEGDTRAPPVFSQALRQRAPVACAWLEQWTRVGPKEQPPPLPSEALSPNELIAAGLMSYLTAEMRPAVEAWLRLEQSGDPGPFVRAGLGMYFVYKQEPGRAYPRLEDADRAFGSVAFLRAAHAEAALGVGDIELAALLLEQARSLPERDEAQLVRLTTLLRLARGDEHGGLDFFREWYFSLPYGHNSVAGYQVGAWLAARGDETRAVGVLAVAVGVFPARPVARLFVPMAERWWDGLSESQRLSVVTRAISAGGKPEPWGEANVPYAYWNSVRHIGRRADLAELQGIIRPHPLAECGRGLETYCTWNSPGKRPSPPQGDELVRAARRVLGLGDAPASARESLPEGSVDR